MQSARNVLDGDAERRGAVAIDVEAQLRFVDFEGGTDVDKHFRLLKPGHELAGVAVQGVEVLRLDRQLKRGAESTSERLRNLRNGNRAFDFVDETALQSVRTADDLLHAAFPVLLEVDEGDALVGFARSIHRQRDDRAVQFDFGR